MVVEQGLALTGLADVLARMNLRYDSDEAIDLVNKIYETFRNVAYAQSITLAKERGSFPVFDFEKEKDNEFLKMLPSFLFDEMKKNGRRNISLLTNAPTR